MELTNHKPEQTESKTEYRNGWTADDKRRLASMAFPLMASQKYTQSMDAKLVLQGWQAKLSGRYTVDQVMYALDKYTDRNDDFPTPANLIALLEPEPVRVTDAEYVQACKWQERNGYDKYTDAWSIKQEYEEQRGALCEEVDRDRQQLANLSTQQFLTFGGE